LLGAIAISNALMVNHSLQELAMGWNNIGDDGIAAIAIALNYSKLNVLDIRNCGITFTGATSLAETLSVNKTIKKLLIWHNVITMEGACLLMQSAVKNEVCYYVMVNDEYDSDDKLTWMKTILEKRNRKNVRTK